MTNEHVHPVFQGILHTMAGEPPMRFCPRCERAHEASEPCGCERTCVNCNRVALKDDFRCLNCYVGDKT